ncbi:hypothetical protein [Marivivens aquimaris]|nr:hypothetical protein [Marivivens aquimaris]
MTAITRPKPEKTAAASPITAAAIQQLRWQALVDAERVMILLL